MVGGLLKFEAKGMLINVFKVACQPFVDLGVCFKV
jgi:hypothetical protein